MPGLAPGRQRTAQASLPAVRADASGEGTVFHNLERGQVPQQHVELLIHVAIREFGDDNCGRVKQLLAG